ncbi:MAG: glycosyltransferase family 4 protein [Clostridiales bacterium]|nr:glycosyltransferase family 4 protein [Clostridiales bacterium]
MIHENIKKKKDKLNICFVAPLPPPYGGIANWMAMMCQYLDKEKKDRIEYSIINTAPKKRVTEGRRLWNRIIDGGLDMLLQKHKLKNALKTGNVDVIHMTTSGSLSIIRDFMFCYVAGKYHVPIVYHIHFGRIPKIQKKNNVEWKILKKVLERVKSIIAIDKTTYSVLERLFDKKVCYISNPINTKLMPEQQKKSQKVVMYLGWVIKEKGIEELLEAWNQVYACYNDWKLQIVGPCKKEYYECLKEMYGMSSVEFLGEQPHYTAMQLLGKSSIFILPSYTEGCPYVILEAMSLGKAVIATNVGNIPEMLSKDCGIIIRSQNSKDIETSLKRLIDSSIERENIGTNAAHKVNDEYEIDKIIRKYTQVWELQKYGENSENKSFDDNEFP